MWCPCNIDPHTANSFTTTGTPSIPLLKKRLFCDIFVTLTALVSFIPCVCSAMVYCVTFCESFATLAAFIWLPASVYPHMFLQEYKCVLKHYHTSCADLVSPLYVYSCAIENYLCCEKAWLHLLHWNVHSQVCTHLWGSIITLTALIWFFSSVCLDVLYELTIPY